MELSTILLQMTLLGDFFNIPYALAGVEWTLRVEIIFYLLMFLLSFSKVVKTKGYFLLFIFIFITLLLKYIAPFPSNNFVGYFTIYFPFLFIGSTLYMYEKQSINLLSLIVFITFIFLGYFYMIEVYQSTWLTSNFAIIGFLVFIFFWLIRNKLYITSINNVVIKSSLLTYSVYLFHNFLWYYIEKILSIFKLDYKIIIFFCLLLWCYIVYKLIEQPMNKIGKKLTLHFKRNNV